MTTRVAGQSARGNEFSGLRRIRWWLTRPVVAEWSLRAKLAVLALIVIGVAMVVASALIHLHLWQNGYRTIPKIGPAFIAQAVGGLVLAAVMLAYRRLVTVILGFLYMAGSIGALIISATVGFLGLHDGLDVPWAATSLIVEIIGAVALAAAGVAIALGNRAH